MTQDKRQHPRAAFNGPVRLQEITNTPAGRAFQISSASISGFAKDLSAGGMRLELPSEKNISPNLKVGFHTRPELLLEIYGRVAWQRGNQCGLEFIIRDENLSLRLREYVGSLAS